MSVIPKITSALKTFSGKPLGVASKAIGIGTCAAILYDSHVNGRERAYSTDEIESADRFSNQFSQYMTSEKESATICKLKSMWFNWQQDFPYYHIGSRIKGYAAGFGNTILKNLPLIGLSAVALKFKNAGKVAGCLIALDAAKTFLYDVAGVGAKKSERHH